MFIAFFFIMSKYALPAVASVQQGFTKDFTSMIDFTDLQSMANRQVEIDPNRPMASIAQAYPHTQVAIQGEINKFQEDVNGLFGAKDKLSFLSPLLDPAIEFLNSPVFGY